MKNVSPSFTIKIKLERNNLLLIKISSEFSILQRFRLSSIFEEEKCWFTVFLQDSINILSSLDLKISVNIMDNFFFFLEIFPLFFVHSFHIPQSKKNSQKNLFLNFFLYFGKNAYELERSIFSWTNGNFWNEKGLKNKTASFFSPHVKNI